MEFAQILKANPYHDEKGRFSTQDKAKFVSIGGVFGKQRTTGSGTVGLKGDIPVSVPKLDKAATLYARSFTGGATASKASEVYLKSGVKGVDDYFIDRVKKTTAFDKNDPSDVEWAETLQASKVLVESIREQPLTSKSLFRGMYSSTGIESLDSAKPGDVLDMNRITSFTESDSVALGYSGGKKNIKYLVEVVGKSRTLKTDDMTGMSHKEHITFGEAKVVSIPKKRYKVVGPDGKGYYFDRHIVVEFNHET